LHEGPLTLSTHGGAVARAPSFVELYGDRGAFLGDPSLLPESAWTVDAGARLASDPRAPVHGRAELVGFATWATDLIVFVPEGAYGRERATNIGRARIVGLEADAATAALGFELRASYTLLATANESVCEAQTGFLSANAACDRPELPGRPTNDLVADLTYTLAPVRLRYGVDAITGMIADEVGAVVVPPRVLQSAGARLDVPYVRGLRLAFDARNLFDVRTGIYEGALGAVREPIGDSYAYPLPGRTFLLSAQWRSEPGN
jgi:outer membrane receptor protein involved in Fe transport